MTLEPSFSCLAVLAEWVPVTMPFSYRICCGIASNLGYLARFLMLHCPEMKVLLPDLVGMIKWTL